MSLVFLGLGTNLGNKEQNLRNAITGIQNEVGNVICQSNYYGSKPWGFESENDFLNMALLVETSLTPTETLRTTQALELKLGREKKTDTHFSDRTIDIDILLYDNLIVDEPTLKIPHQLLHLRDFVLIPLAAIAPNVVHPLIGKTIIELKKILEEKE